MKKKFLSMLLCLCLMVGIVPAMTAQAASNPYPYWQSFTYNGREYTTITCTYYAWQQVYDRHGIALPSWGNAGSWLDGARSSGYQTGTEARSGSLAVWKPSASNGWGHVGYVTSAGGGSFTYNEGGTANSRANSLGIYEGHTQPDGYTSWPDGFIYLNASAPSKPSVAFSPWSKDGYTYVGETDASIGQLITVSGGTCTEVGMYLYDTAGRELAFAKNGSYSSNVPQIYFKINEECGYTLAPGTTYKYNFYAIVNGEVYWGTESSFVTNGTSSQPTASPSVEPPPIEPAPITTETEDNNTIATADAISVNTQVTGSVSDKRDNDWYVFQIPSDGYVSLTFDHDFVNSSSDYWETTFLEDASNSLRSWEWSGNDTKPSTTSKIGLPAGTHYLRIRGGYYTSTGSTTWSSVPYRFTVNYTASSTWEKEFNDTVVAANPISTDTEFSGSIYGKRDNDWYVFQMPSDGYVSLTFDHDFVNSSSDYWETTFLNDTSDSLRSWEWSGNDTKPSTTSKIGLPAGTYYLRIRGGYYTSTGSTTWSSDTYRFTVNYTASSTWEKEFNDTIVTANPISTDTEFSGSIYGKRDNDWYVFQIPSEGYVSLTFDHDFINSSSDYWETTFLEDSNKSLRSWEWSGNDTKPSTTSKIGLPAGTYYLRIRGGYYTSLGSNTWSSATYRFTVNFENPKAPTPTPVPTHSPSPSPNPTHSPTQKPTSSPNPTMSPAPSSRPAFTDVPSNAYYATPVAWAVAEGITSGTSRTTFSPNKTCTRAEVVTFLWNSAGRPNPTSTTNPFVDVKDNAWYKKAVLWAVENNITSGTGRGRFSPNASCTRGQIVTFLWNAEGKPEPESSSSPFGDVNGTAYYNSAVLWAVENDITSGTGGGKFSPGANCTRGQIVTFLYRNR